MVVNDSGLTQRQSAATPSASLPLVGRTTNTTTNMDNATTLRRRRTPAPIHNHKIKSWMLIIFASVTIFMFGIFISLISQHKKQLKGGGGGTMMYSKRTNKLGNNCPHGEERTWHGGHPAQDHSGSCWCGADEYCMCTPSVAIDIVLYQKRPKNDSPANTNTNNYDVWVVRRSDTNQLATIGGFVDTGETTESAVLREVEEETGITIPPNLMSSHYGSHNNDSAIKLIGVYSDPRRDNRRHIVSIAYALEFNPDTMTTRDGSGIPKAGDDAKDVIAIPLEDIGVTYVGDDWYADHLSILLDFKVQVLNLKGNEVDRTKELFGGGVTRSTCVL